MSVQVKLTGLKVFAYHGVLDSEAAYGQDFFIDCLMDVKVGHKDLLEEAVDYSAVSELIVKTTQQTRFNLIESLAYALAQGVLNYSKRVIKVTITVNKPNAPIEHSFENVSASYTEKRR